MASSSLSGWGEGILFSLAFVIILAGVLSSMNVMYNKNYVLGINEETNQTQTLFVQKINIGVNESLTGEAMTTAYGVQPKNALGIIRDFASITWTFLNGSWIDKLAVMIGGGQALTTLAIYLRILFVSSLIFGVLYAIFKVTI